MLTSVSTARKGWRHHLWRGKLWNHETLTQSTRTPMAQRGSTFVRSRGSINGSTLQQGKWKLLLTQLVCIIASLEFRPKTVLTSVQEWSTLCRYIQWLMNAVFLRFLCADWVDQLSNGGEGSGDCGHSKYNSNRF